MSDDLRQIISDAGLDPAALGPFAAVVEAFDAVVQARLPERPSPGLPEVSDFDPWRIYT